MRTLNIVIFSSGISESNGILTSVKGQLEEKGYNCSCWRDLFVNANDSSNIALLPMLIKKIPTFDFAVLICQGHDKTQMMRQNQFIEVKSMRDNVLFEIGMCAMGLGLNKTILLTDSEVHLPEDLVGIQGKVALKHIVYSTSDSEASKDAAGKVAEYIENARIASEEIHRHIAKNKGQLYPVVIGAATSIAGGYITNFIFRTIEAIEEGFTPKEQSAKIKYPLNKIFIHILLPERYTDKTPEGMNRILSEMNIGEVTDARQRPISFRYKIIGEELHIFDVPTTMVTSYNTARMILNISADDGEDVMAEERFTAKELDLFEGTLRRLLTPSFVKETIEHFYKDSTEKEKAILINRVNCFIENQIIITREEF